MNDVYLNGVAQYAPVYSHTLFGEDFYSIEISTMRTSGIADCIPCILPSDIADGITQGQSLDMNGEIRTTYKMDDSGKSHMKVYFLVKELCEGLLEENTNLVVLDGYICKEPVLRQTPSGKIICDLHIACERGTMRKSDYIPCICWGGKAVLASQFEVGSKIWLQGRFQSRDYLKKIDGKVETRRAYEVSVSNYRIIDLED